MPTPEKKDPGSSKKDKVEKPRPNPAGDGHHEVNEKGISHALLSATPSGGKVSHGSMFWGNIKASVSAIAGESYRQRSERTAEEAGAAIHAIQADDIMDRKEAESAQILELLKNSNFFKSLPEKNKKALLDEEDRRAGKIHALDILAMKEKGEQVDSDDEEYTKDRKQREKAEEEFRLKYLWGKRSRFSNWALWIIFHLSVLINFAICFEESFTILVEHAKFDRLYLNDDFNCLDRVLSGDWVNHFFNIMHACACVAVLFTDHLVTANLCWTYVVAQLCHASCDTFQFLYNIRFPSEDKAVDSPESIGVFICYLSFMLLSTLIVVQRYYDMTNILQKRTQRFTSSLYTGRLLNEHIIYKNESTFLQKKYTMRQAQSLQIYGIVQKLEHFKQRGLEPDPADIQKDVKEACETLKDLKNYTGSNLLRALRKKNAERLKKLEAMDSLDEIGVDAQGDHNSRRDNIRRERRSQKLKKSIKKSTVGEVPSVEKPSVDKPSIDKPSEENPTVENPINVENPAENPLQNLVENPVENPVQNPVENPPVENPVENPLENPPAENPAVEL